MDLLDKVKARLAAPGPVVCELEAPDQGAFVTPYACSYHWFRGPDGRMLGADLVRSDDRGEVALRFMRERPDGGLDALLLGAPRAEWAGFLTEADASIDAGPRGKPLLVRRRGFVAARCAGGTGNLREVRFELEAEALRPGFGSGALGLEVSQLAAIDFSRIHYRGYVEIDGVRSAIDAHGTASVHYGHRLPAYAYLLTVRRGADDPSRQILAAAVRDDAAIVCGELVAGRALAYAYGDGGLPAVSMHLGDFGRDFPLGNGGRIEISDVRPVVHDLLGQPTWTATATARHHPRSGEPADLGRVILDYRGAEFLKALSGA